MVGLVLVSHSRAVAEALRKMLHRLYGEELPVAVAAGAGDGGEELGTDAAEIQAAIESVCGEEGALVFLDLGSAVLSAELALELLDEDSRKRAALCAAPLVEGAIAAGAQIKAGATLEAAKSEAGIALRQKMEHLASGEKVGPEPEPDEAAPDAEVTLRIENAHGLHVRPAMRIVQCVSGFRSDVRIRNLRTNGAYASARSLVAINCLDARNGDEIRVVATGEDAGQAVAALRELHGRNFGDAMDSGGDAGRPHPRPKRSSEAVASEILGETICGGKAVGPLRFARRAVSFPPDSQVSKGDVAAETSRLKHAVASVRIGLDGQIREVSQKLGEESASILEAHRLLADDPALEERAIEILGTERVSAVEGWRRAASEAEAAYRELSDPVLRERAGDIEDVSLRVLAELGVRASLDIDLSGEPCVLAVPSLLPGDVARLDLGKIRGVIAESIGPTSHAAIFLRAAGIPCVDGVSLSRIRPDASMAAMDADGGEVWIDPPESVIRRLGEKSSEIEADAAMPPLQTRDGRRIELAANVSRPADASVAVRRGAEAVGLLRTEFLFLDRSEAPQEEDQVRALAEILDALPSEWPVTVRTLDIGGDKPAPYLPQPAEANPFLGVRGVRLALRHPDLFRIHLRALLRALCGRRGRILFPMVTDPGELRQSRSMLMEAHEALASAEIGHAWPVQVGMMVEVPAAAINAMAFADDVDFFSIGTNDLTQYTLAAERGHPQLRAFSDALHPGVLRLIARVAAVARKRGLWAGVCGEAAADPAAARVFVGLGITELSVGGGGLAAVRRAIGESTWEECRSVARATLRGETACLSGNSRSGPAPEGRG